MLGAYNNIQLQVPTSTVGNYNTGIPLDCRPLTTENSKQFTVSSLLRLKQKRSHSDSHEKEGIFQYSLK